MPSKEYNPIQPSAKDCIICMDGEGGREDFFSIQEGNIATLIERYKMRYEKITGNPATRIAIYYLESVSANHIVGISL
jgi:hypothetical protein